MSTKKLYIRIEAGEEGYYFTKEEGLRLLTEEYARIEKENKQDDSEFGYEWDWVWLTEEEYREADESVDKPRYESPTPQSIEQPSALLEKYPHVTGTTEDDNSRLTMKRGDLFALMEEYRSQYPSQQGKGGMRWVKAKERMPIKEGRTVVKRLGEPMVCDATLRNNGEMVFTIPNGMTWKGYKDFEWLDESPEPTPSTDIQGVVEVLEALCEQYKMEVVRSFRNYGFTFDEKVDKGELPTYSKALEIISSYKSTNQNKKPI